MRPTLLLFVALAASGAHASWFGSDTPAYASWSQKELTNWLKEHNIETPSTPSQAELQALVKANWNTASAWTQEQYTQAQKSFSNLQEASFDAWDESRLRAFLVEQGVVEPSGPKEKLVAAAKQKYRAYNSFASSLSASATSFASVASASASTAIYGDSQYQASKSISSYYAQKTAEANKALDDSKDYIYSSWNDNQLRDYLVEKGVIKSNAEKKRDELLQLMRTSYASLANPVWQAWSDSAIYAWLVDHGLVRTPIQKTRDNLVAEMEKYYYTSADTVYAKWSDSELRDWLIQNNVIKSDAQVKREKMERLVKDNYYNAKSSVWGAWGDSDMRSWLIEQGYLKSDAQKTREELVALMDTKYKETSSKVAPYLVWPDARLRAYLREHDLSESAVPTSRPGLLQEVRIRWVQTTTRAENLFAMIKEITNNGVGAAEDSVSKILELIAGSEKAAEYRARHAYNKASASGWSAANEAYATAQASGASLANEAYATGSSWATEAYATAAASGSSMADKAYTTGKSVAGEAYASGASLANEAYSTGKASGSSLADKAYSTGSSLASEAYVTASASGSSLADQAHTTGKSVAGEAYASGASLADEAYATASVKGKGMMKDARAKVGEALKYAGRKVEGEL